MKKFILSCLLLSPLSLSANVVDVDSDEKNDIVVVERTDDAIDFSALTSNSSFQTSTSLSSGFGTKSQTPLAGNWTGNTFTPATIKLKNNGNYQWKVGQSGNREIGQKKNSLLIGFDFDNNGISDFAVVDKKTGQVSIHQNLFTTNSSSSFNLNFSKKTAKGYPVSFAPGATGARATTGTLFGFVTTTGKKARKRYNLKAKDSSGNDYSANLGAHKGNLYRVYAYDTGSGKEGVLAVFKTKKNFKLVLHNTTSGNTSSTQKGRVRKLITGNYSGNPGDEIILRKGKDTNELINLNDDTKVNVGVEGNFISEVILLSRSKSGGSSSSSSSGSSGGAGLNSVCPGGIRGLGVGVLWKPDSDVNDARGGKPVVLFQGGNKPRTGAINIYASNGQQIGRFTFKAPNEAGINGNSDHYYSGWVGGSAETGGQLAAEARAAAGSSKVYFTGPGSSCFGPAEPDSRNGSIG